MKPTVTIAASLCVLLGGCTGPVEPADHVTQALEADVSSVDSGDWDDPAVWSTGRVPQADDRVEIAMGDRVTLAGDGQAAQLEVLGTLVMSREQDSHLRLGGNLVVGAEGTLDMGTRDDPIPQNVTVRVSFEVDSNDGYVGGHGFEESDVGLWVLSEGRWDTHGSPVEETWVELAEDAAAGADELHVRGDVTDWPEGGQLLVTSTTRATRAPQGDNDFETEDELRRIAGIYEADDGTTVVELDAPLEHAHQGSGDASGEVALLERNVIVESSGEGRAHTAFLHGAAGSVAFTSFEHLGPRGIDNRHPLLLDRMVETSVGMVLHGNVVRDSDNGGIVLHSALGTRISKNIVFRVLQSGFRLLPNKGDWPESLGNALLKNMAVKLTSIDRHGRRQSGFNIKGTNRYLGNVTASIAGSGDTSGYVWPEGGYRGMRWVMVGNESHANHHHGAFGWWNNGFGDVVSFTAWRNGDAGVHWGAYKNPIQFHHLKAFGNEDENFRIKSATPWIQDSELYGEDDYPTRFGGYIVRYTLPPSPDDPGRIVRSTLRNHTEADMDHIEQTTCDPDDSGCTPTFTAFQQSQLQSERPIRFGNDWKREDTYFDLQGWDDNPYDLPPSFRITRHDQPQPSEEAFYNEEIDGWIDPAHPQPTAWELPPQVRWVEVPAELGSEPARLVAEASGFTGEEGSLEVYVDGLERGAPWTAELYTNTELDGDPLATFEVPDPRLSVKYESLLPGVLEFGNWSARFAHTAHFDEGRYRFPYLGNDGIRVRIDGELLVDEWGRTRPHCCSVEGEVELELTEGEHTIELEYFNGDTTSPMLSFDVLRAIEGGEARSELVFDPSELPYVEGIVYARAYDAETGMRAYSEVLQLGATGASHCTPSSCNELSCGPVADGCGGTLDCGPCGDGSADLRYSTAADRSESMALDGASVEGDIYVFVTGEDIEAVTFLLDDAAEPVSMDTEPPFDLEGTAEDGMALPFDTTALEAGTHEVTAEVGYAGGDATTLTASFDVGSAAASDGGIGSRGEAGDGGCGCRVPGSSTSGGALPVAALLLTALAFLRRRRS